MARVPICPGGAALSIAGGVREFGRSRPGALAVVDGERSLTYAALRARACRLASSLLRAGLRPGERVAVLLGNRLEYPEVAVATAMAGLVLVPLNPRFTPAEAAYVLVHSGSRALVADAALASVLEGVDAVAGMLLQLTIDGDLLGPEYESALEAADERDPCLPVAETEPFCIAYTSGTTGRPKGVLISHRSRSLTFYAAALEWGLGPGRRTVAVAPMHHGAGFAFGFAAVHTGGTVAMLRAFDPEQLLAMLGTEHPHSVFLVPTHAQLLRALGDDVVRRADVSSLETLYFNAAPLPMPLKEWVLDIFPAVGVHELYGSTEAGIVTDLRPDEQRTRPGSVGPAWLMTELRVVDDEGHPVPPGTPGELFSRSPYLMNGYLDDEAATSACTTPDGFLTSGDVVVQDEDGYVTVVDRKKDLIISGGLNIYPREVEEVLAGFPGLAEAAVVGVPDETWGESVVAFVVPLPGSPAAVLDDRALEELCRSRLAGYKVPRRWERVPALPRNTAGKVLKTELRARAEARR